MAREFLPTIQFPVDEMGKVVQAIVVHDEHGAQETLEEKIVYDSDRLDCFTRTGVIRCVLEPYITHKSLLDGEKAVITLTEIVNDVRRYLDVAYKSLNTETAKKIADLLRQEFLDEFLDKLKEEQVVL